MDATSVVTENSDYHIKFSGQSTPGTKTLTTGQYSLMVWATSGTDRKTIAQYPITVTADLSAGTPAQQHALKMLPIIEAAIEARISGNADGGLESYAVEGTSVTKLPMAELQKLRARYAGEVARMQNPNAPIGSVKFYFAQSGSITDVRRRFLTGNGNIPGSIT